MSTAMQGTATKAAKRDGVAADDGRVDAADEELARQLAERARAEGLSLTGPGGLLGRRRSCGRGWRCLGRRRVCRRL
ncbi:MAG TPA: hypothetical protein VGS19_01565 [Streptosporangiaceae bacterium]|nr:hypothetical protein [Streptosporangiaceae bacterium]